MNISTNYSNQSRMIASASHRQNVRNNNSQPCSNPTSNDVNFTGLNLRSIYMPIKESIFGMSKEQKNRFNDLVDFIAPVLSKDNKEIKEMLQGQPAIRIDFLGRLSNRLNTTNFYKKAEEKESPELVIDLFNKIKKPTVRHLNFIDNVDMDMKNIKTCIEKYEVDDKKLEQVENVFSQFRRNERPQELVMEIIESPNSDLYLENFDSYKTFIKNNSDNKDVIKILDKKVSRGEFDPDRAKKVDKLTNALYGFPETEAVSMEKFIPNYSEEGNDILSSIRIKLNPTVESLEKGDANALLDIYKSTTSENAELRINFLESNYHNLQERSNFPDNEIENINKLFKIFDTDKNARKFATSLMEKTNLLTGAGSYLKAFEEIGSERLSADVKRAAKAIKSDIYNPLQSLLDEFSGKKSVKKFSFTDKLKGLFSKKSKQVKEPEFDDYFIKMEDVKPSVSPLKEEPVIKIDFNPVFDKPVKIDVQPEKTVVKKEPFSLAKANRAKLSELLTNTPSKSMGKKLTIAQKDVAPVLKKSIKSQTILDEQEYLYTINATKMRANMLPEIFASIKDSRKAAKANGTFSKSKTVSNEDAIDLYTRINGKNKKLVNYMLKIRNADGTRKFSVKDIIETLAEGNRTTLKKKSLATKTERFTAKDEKAIYDSMLAEKIEQYGKLPKAKKK